MDNKTCFFSEAFLQSFFLQLVTVCRSAAALPYDCMIYWLPSRFIPYNRRFSLIRNADCRNVMALDAGTTGNRCILFNERGEMCSIAQKEFNQFFPEPGFVEQDANSLHWNNPSHVSSLLSASRSTKYLRFRTTILRFLHFPLLLLHD